MQCCCFGTALVCSMSATAAAASSADDEVEGAAADSAPEPAAKRAKVGAGRGFLAMGLGAEGEVWELPAGGAEVLLCRHRLLRCG